MRWMVELFVTLQVPDVIALTARDTLRRRLGWSERLLDLTRADYWGLQIEASSREDAAQLAHELADRTTLFVNPNKHRYEVRVRELGDAPKTTTACPEIKNHHAVRVLTGFQQDDGGELTLETLHIRYDMKDRVIGVEKGTLWILALATSNASEARDWAEAITVTRSRETGVLANPHSQWWRWAE